MERRKALADRLASLGRNEKHKLYKEAAKLRRDSERRRPGPKRASRADLDDEPETPVKRRQSLDDWVIRLLDSEAARPITAAGIRGTVTAVRGPRCVVEVGGERRTCTLHLGEMRQTPAVGDEVNVDDSKIVGVLPRRTFLGRPDPSAPARDLVIVANVDLIAIVVSIRKPPLHPRLIDRYLVAIQRGGAQPAVCVNKTDLAESPEELESELAKLDPYRALGVPVVTCSAEVKRGMEDLRALLAGKRSAFVGHSGVGKTSILNALAPGLAMASKQVHRQTGQGRHTTTASTMVDVGDGARVIDTPGIRSFGVDFRDLSELAGYFPEFAECRCRFGDCTHLHEPGCGVKDAVSNGRLLRERYETYRRLAGDCAPETVPEGPFECRNCGESVTPGGAGTEHRNHCPRCLHSVHLDVHPGDRAAACGGLMEPVAVWVRNRGEWAVIHRCVACGRFSSNRIAGDDNEVLLMSLAVKPLAQPPFPLDRL